MKKTFILAVALVLIVSSCGTYTGAGAYTGTHLGGILGSAIGGISNGHRGHDVGTIVGMAGGAIIGGAIGAQADKKKADDYAQYKHDKAERAAARKARQNAEINGGYDDYDSGFDATNSGDDRIYDFTGEEYSGEYKGSEPTTMMPSTSSVEQLASAYTYTPTIEIRNARFIDDNGDNRISRGELCKVIFEVYNHGKAPLYDVEPTVIDATRNKHIYISPGMHVERIDPGRGIRYTALVKGDNRLKDGSVKLCISVVQGNHAISKVSEFNIVTSKK